ncbi:MAG: hypothetical protein RIS92_3114 [Verrucomicrobiota bacterium]
MPLSRHDHLPARKLLLRPAHRKWPGRGWASGSEGADSAGDMLLTFHNEFTRFETRAKDFEGEPESGPRHSSAPAPEIVSSRDGSVCPSAPTQPPKKQPPKTSAPEDFVKGGKTPAAPRCKNRFAPVAPQQHVVNGIRKFNPYASDITQKMETTAILSRVAPCPPFCPRPRPSH